jgi:hypothetical protein
MSNGNDYFKCYIFIIYSNTKVILLAFLSFLIKAYFFNEIATLLMKCNLTTPGWCAI